MNSLHLYSKIVTMCYYNIIGGTIFQLLQIEVHLYFFSLTDHLMIQLNLPYTKIYPEIRALPKCVPLRHPHQENLRDEKGTHFCVTLRTFSPQVYEGIIYYKRTHIFFSTLYVKVLFILQMLAIKTFMNGKVCSLFQSFTKIYKFLCEMAHSF